MIFNKYTCTISQLPNYINKLKNRNLIPIIDYINENENRELHNFIEIKDKIYQYDNNYIALKMSSLNINYNKSYAMILTNQIIDLAIYKKSKILIDAEEDIIQNKIDFISDECMKKYNKNEVNVYKTYQMYKKNSLSKFKNDLTKERDYYIGIKLVRGAYLNKDKEKGVLCDNYEETNNNYNKAIFEFMKNSKINDKLMCATHNENSINYAKTLINEKNKDKIEFAQLMGMSDKLSNSLVNDNYKVYKYLPYGNFYESIPYLIRRLYENYDMIKYL